MGVAKGFEYQLRKSGEVVIFHHGRQATILRGDRAERFLVDCAGEQDQELMARVTGNYRRGNERESSKRGGRR